MSMVEERQASAQASGWPLPAGVRADLLTQLQKAEGQVRGINRMVAEDRYCVDVLMQVEATRKALRTVAGILILTQIEQSVCRGGRGLANRKKQAGR
ncbi:MAG TPA: metal-sensitive transcriptional regulator [Symbiobacteriaceae bacterium]|jgi:DNA-binding FrmR family transcriptional regulator